MAADQSTRDPVIEAVFAASRILLNHINDILDRHRLTLGGLKALDALQELSGELEVVRMRDLSDRLGVAARTTTEIVDNLISAEFVTRQRHPRDRRAFQLVITPESVGRLETARHELGSALGTVIDHLDDEEREQLRSLLDRLRKGVPVRSGRDGIVHPMSTQPLA